MVILASGEVMLRGFAVLSTIVGIIGAGLWLQSARNKKARMIGVTLLISGIALVVVLVVYCILQKDRTPF